MGHVESSSTLRITPGPPALGAWSLSHWTTREVSLSLYLDMSEFWLIQEVEDSVEIQFTISLRIHHIETVVDTWLRRFMGLLEHQEKNRCE